MEEIKLTVIELIKSNCNYPEIEEYLSHNDNLVEIGLDSINYIRIIVALEEEFDIEFEEAALGFSNFTSLDLLCKYIQSEIDKKTVESIEVE